ncbi:MAG: glycosyltransferase family 39 protein [Acidobacteria bacterium]|nr:glycosyltransferase family 39 protein [Acidobacteriota bacterium]
MRRTATATVLLALFAGAYWGLFAANSLIRVRTFTADSMNYVDVARQVVAGDGLVQSTGGFNQPFYLSGNLDLPSAFTAQPPGYPLAIALLSRLGMDEADTALVVSALAYAAILALVYLLGKRIGGSAAALIALGAALLCVPLTHLGRAALSECLAVAVVLLFFLLLDRLLERGLEDQAPWRALLLHLALGLLAGAAFGVRYSLWPLPLVGIAALWLGGSGPREERRDAARRLVPTFAVGALVPVAWILGRNLSVEGNLLPAAMPAVTTLPESLERAVTAVLGGWRSTTVGNWPDAAVLAVVLGFLGAFAIRAARNSARPPARSRLPLLFCLWSVLYLAAVVWRSTQANFDPIGVRLALPATVPLIPVFGALIGASLPSARRLAWLPFAVLLLCFGAASIREATLWASGRDARAMEFQSERQQWLRDHTGLGDLVIGGGTMDMPFLVPGSHAISYAGLPYTEVLSYADLERITDRHCRDFDRLLLVVRPTVQLGGGRSDEDPSDWLGPFIADARAGRHEPYPLLEPLATLTETRVYRITCP